MFIPRHIDVAIKILHSGPVQYGDGPPLGYQRELDFLRSIRHPHVVTFYGAGVLAESNLPYLVTELVALGTLGALLQDHAKQLSWSIRLQFVEDISSGLRYLHSVHVVHRDVKPDNLFVDIRMRLKLGDFGTGRLATVMQPVSDQQSRTWAMGRHVRRLRTLTSNIGSLLWMAPEVLMDKKIPASQAHFVDIYRYECLGNMCVCLF